MKDHGNAGRIDTTIGELIAAVSEAAFEYCDNTEEAYIFTQAALAEILKNRRHIEENEGFGDARYRRKAYLN